MGRFHKVGSLPVISGVKAGSISRFVTFVTQLEGHLLIFIIEGL